MPTYSYNCSICKASFDAFQKITEEALKECPHCHKEGLQRGIGGGEATFQFMGSGFYETDYKKTASSSSCSSSCNCSCKEKCSQ